MLKIEDEELDKILFESLSSPVEIPAGMNADLKRKLRQPAVPRTINLWFAILLANAAMTLFSETIVFLMISVPFIQILAVGHVFLSLVALGAFTLLGHKYPSLKEGAFFHI